MTVLLMNNYIDIANAYIIYYHVSMVKQLILD